MKTVSKSRRPDQAEMDGNANVYFYANLAGNVDEEKEEEEYRAWDLSRPEVCCCIVHASPGNPDQWDAQQEDNRSSRDRTMGPRSVVHLPLV